jgi:hypothetical protein
MFLEKQDWSGTECPDITAPPCAPDIRPERSLHDRETRPSALTGLEQSVVALSLFDHRSSIDPPQGIRRLLTRAFGFQPANELADDRLEALRRYCILLRVSPGAPAAAARDRMGAAGYSDAALEQAGRLVAIGRSRR